ncbi:MAG: archease [Candidatus Bathyarchaeia archaeon]
MMYRYPEDGPPADLTVEGFGDSLAEAISSVVLGMFNTIVSLEGIEKRDLVQVEAEGHDVKSLIFNLMDELLYINDIDGFIASEVHVELEEDNLKGRAECQGEALDPEKHQIGIAIKAVTYHQMRIDESEDGWRVRVVFDT